MTYDNVNPDHYRGNRKHEPIDVIEDWGLNYRLGCAVKYISRNGRKPGEDPREGLKKAIWYLEREINSLAVEIASSCEVKYEDVLEYYGQTRDEREAWPEQIIPFEATEEDWEAFWNDSDFELTVTTDNVFLEKKTDELWDPSLGPVELSEEEVSSLLSKKDLNQFEDDEIVSTVERRGTIIGFRKDGSSCVLKDGRCA